MPPTTTDVAPPGPRWLPFLSRVALVCNLFFALSVLQLWKPFLGDGPVLSTILILGYFLAVFIFNPLVNLIYLIQSLRRRHLFVLVPRYLVWANVGFLVLQIVYIILFLNDPVHH